jgi:hypothetical protein
VADQLQRRKIAGFAVVFSLCQRTLAELMYDENLRLVGNVQKYFTALFVKVL